MAGPTIDIDNEDDFELAERIIKSRASSFKPNTMAQKRGTVVRCASILPGFGVVVNQLDGGNEEVVSIQEVIDRWTVRPLSRRLINTEATP